MSFRLFDNDQMIWETFDYKNFWRNECISFNSYCKIKKTGTTIAGLIFNNGVILAADTRATNGNIVCDINCDKMHFISKNISCCGAGTSADTENITKMVSDQLELQRITMERESKVQYAVNLFKKILYQHQGLLSAAIIMAGFDSDGGHLFAIHPHGSTESLPFIAMGSGSLAAMSVLERLYDNFIDSNMAISIVKEAILAGIYNDLGSGGNIDFCIITKHSLQLIRSKINQNLIISRAEFLYKKKFIAIL